jgi:hypothetical protein
MHDGGVTWSKGNGGIPEKTMHELRDKIESSGIGEWRGEERALGKGSSLYNCPEEGEIPDREQGGWGEKGGENGAGESGRD